MPTVSLCLWKTFSTTVWFIIPWCHRPICSTSCKNLLHSVALSFAAFLTVTILTHKDSVIHCWKGSNDSTRSGNHCSLKLTSANTFFDSCGYLAWQKSIIISFGTDPVHPVCAKHSRDPVIAIAEIMNCIQISFLFVRFIHNE